MSIQNSWTTCSEECRFGLALAAQPLYMAGVRHASSMLDKLLRDGE
jgi:hypothetical protein